MEGSFMSKYHINKNGVPAPCRAKEGNCPYGGMDGNEDHFDTLEEAQKHIDNENERIHGLAAKVKTSLTADEGFQKIKEMIIENNAKFSEEQQDGYDDSYNNLYGWSPGEDGHHDARIVIKVSNESLQKMAESMDDYEYEGFLEESQEYIKDRVDELKSEQHYLTSEEKEEIFESINKENRLEMIENDVYGIFESVEFSDYIKDELEDKTGGTVDPLHLDTEIERNDDDSYTIISTATNVDTEFTKDDYDMMTYDPHDDLF